METWKDIPGYERIYEASNLGRVRTHINKTTRTKKHGVRKWKQRVLKQKTDKNGYKRVTLWKDNKSKDFLVHRLVALAFIPLVDGKDCINHVDGNPSNNNVENIEWCNHKENLMHAYKTGLNKTPDPVILFNKNTGQSRFFYSKAAASRFLGKADGYLSGLLIKGKTEVKNYMIFVEPSKECSQ